MAEQSSGDDIFYSSLFGEEAPTEQAPAEPTTETPAEAPAETPQEPVEVAAPEEGPTETPEAALEEVEAHELGAEETAQELPTIEEWCTKKGTDLATFNAAKAYATARAATAGEDDEDVPEPWAMGKRVSEEDYEAMIKAVSEVKFGG